MKKILALLLSLVMAFSLSACQEGMDVLEKLENIELPPLPEVTATAEPVEELQEPAETETPEGPDGDALINYETLDLDNRVTVNIGSTSREEFDPESGNQLILTFSYETPHVSIQGRDGAAQAINDYIAMLDETFYTGNDYGAGTALGFNTMLEFAQDHYGYTVYNNIDFDIPFSASRTVSIARADDHIFSLVYDDYIYSGNAHGSQQDKAYIFDTETGERLSLEALCDDYNVLRAAVVEYMTGLPESDPGYYARIDFEMMKNTMGVEDFTGACEALLREGSWYLDLNGLVVFADQGEMGPMVSGMIEFHIPYAELSDVIDDKWIPEDKSANGRFNIRPMADIEDGTLEIIDYIPADESGEEFCLIVEGTVYDVLLSHVHYSDAFYETAQLWHASHMSGNAVQLQTVLPDGMPELMISYTSGGERHNMLLTHDEDGSPALVDDGIEAVG